MTSTIVKDPDADLDYGTDWTPWLDDLGDTIASSLWLCDDPSITLHDDTHDATTAKVWLSGGTPNVDYTVTNRITTAAGRVDDRSLKILVRQR